jgi:hypothetical protein
MHTVCAQDKKYVRQSARSDMDASRREELASLSAGCTEDQPRQCITLYPDAFGCVRVSGAESDEQDSRGAAAGIHVSTG